jgi:hypothetical protein
MDRFPAVEIGAYHYPALAGHPRPEGSFRRSWIESSACTADADTFHDMTGLRAASVACCASDLVRSVRAEPCRFQQSSADLVKRGQESSFGS